METKIFDLATEYEAGMREAAREISRGGLVVFPTETVYGIGADAMNPAAVAEIFAVKGRPSDNPLIVHICEPGQAGELAREISPMARRVMEAFMPGPFTAVLKCRDCVPACVTAGLDSVGIRMPGAAHARELIRRSGKFIAAPSANLSGKPSPTRVQHVIDDFAGKVPVILNGGEAAVGLESTVCDLTGDIPLVLRPGGVTPEMIREVAGDVRVARAVLEGLPEGEKVASPGMKYKHYAPRARVVVVDGECAKAIAICVNSMYDREENKGKKSLIFCTDEHRPLYGGRRTYSLGRDLGEEAHRLFDALRQADKDRTDTIFFEAVEPRGMGLAVMNRIIRAAGFQIVHAAEEG